MRGNQDADSQIWGGGEPWAPAAAAEEDEAPAPVAPVKTKKKTACH